MLLFRQYCILSPNENEKKKNGGQDKTRFNKPVFVLSGNPTLVLLLGYVEMRPLFFNGKLAFCNKRSHGTKSAMLEGKLIIIPALGL